jgi:Cu/Ag efflux protein CusF
MKCFNQEKRNMKRVTGSIAIGLLVAAAAMPAAFAAGTSGAMQQGMAEASTSAAQQPMSHGEIKKIDVANGKLTIKHGPLENLGMGAMTMTFKAKDPAMLSQVKVGEKIAFVAEEIGGVLTVTTLEKQ